MKKVAIVGVEGSGKTVMLAGLGELYTQPDEGGYFLAPKNFGTAAYVGDKIARMRKGEWPTATAGDEMAEYVRECSLPIVVSSASINASAAYEISSQADYIFVAKSTEIGAIGTVMTITDLSGLFDKLGINMDTIASADEKDSSYGYRPLTDEEREYYQAMVNEINEVFIENVAQGRGMTVEEVRALANGMPFTGVTAVKNGIADEIGTREDAIEKAAELAGITDYDVTSLGLESYDLSALYYLLGYDNTTLDRLLELADRQATGASIR